MIDTLEIDNNDTSEVFIEEEIEENTDNSGIRLPTGK